MRTLGIAVWWVALGMGSAPALAATSGAVPKAREPHVRWQQQVDANEEAASLARWFMPGTLGYEPGAAAPGPQPEGYLTRALGVGPTPEEAEWQTHNHLTPRLDFSHNLSRVFPPSLFAEHPEFFPEIADRRWAPPAGGRVNWQPDLGEAAVADWAAKAAGEFFAAHPEAISFALGINDAARYGESAATLRWVQPPRFFRGRPNYSDLVFNFMNAVAERTEATWPDRHLGALAYYWTEQVPTFDVHPKVLPYLTADRSQGYDRAFLREEEDLQRRWGRAGPERLGIYDYLYGHGFLVPRQHTELLARHLRHARKAGFTDYYAEVYPNWGLDGPQPWLVAQLLQDPEQSARALLDEYYRRYFRAAARSMRAFFEGCERQWMNQPGPAYWLKHYRSETQASLYPPEARRALRAHLGEAEALTAHDAVARERVRLVSAAFAVTERLAEFTEQQHALARAVLSWPKGSRAELAALHAGTDAARARLISEYEGLRARHPLALGAVKLDDFIRSDWRPAAAQLLRPPTEPALEWKERLADPKWFLPMEGGEVIAGLTYAPAVPRGWVSKSEPWQGMTTEMQAGQGGARTLRLENHKLTTLHTVVMLTDDDAWVRGAVQVRGQSSPGARLWLRLWWVGKDGEMGKEHALILPPGDWREGGRLDLPLIRPADAAGVALLITLCDQQPGDWWELSAPSVRTAQGGAGRGETFD